MERRRFLRLETPLDVAIKLASAPEASEPHPLFHGKTRDISREGICLETRFIEIDGRNLLAGSPGARKNRLDIFFRFSPDDPPFQTLGELAWYDVVPDSSGSIYLMGIQFLKISVQGKEALLNFLKSHDHYRKFLHKLKK